MFQSLIFVIILVAVVALACAVALLWYAVRTHKTVSDIRAKAEADAVAAAAALNRRLERLEQHIGVTPKPPSTIIDTTPDLKPPDAKL